MSRLKIGMIGIGVGGAEILPAMEAMDAIEIAAGADVVPETLTRFKAALPRGQNLRLSRGAVRRPGCRRRCGCPVPIGSTRSTRFWRRITASMWWSKSRWPSRWPTPRGWSRRLRKTTIKLLAGHTRAFTLPIRAMRKVIESGKYGQLRALNIWSYSDWMLRPRTADELDLAQGGGIPYRQGPHQVDTVRLLGGGMLRSVRAQVGQWMPERPIPGAYSAFMEFENGTPATISHNGYGYFMGAELVPWGEDRQRYTAEQRASIRQQLRSGTRAETAEKQALRIGGEQEQRHFPAPRTGAVGARGHGHGDRQPGPRRRAPVGEFGIYMHSDEGKRDIDMVAGRDMGVSQRRAELEELYDAVVGGQPLWHDGRWGMATLEVCLAIMESGRERKEIMLQHQVPVPDGYDADLAVPGF